MYLCQVTEVTEKPVGLVERVRRRSVEMVLGVDAAPDAAALAAMLDQAEEEEEDDFKGFGFSGEAGTGTTAGQERERGMAMALFTEYDADGALSHLAFPSSAWHHMVLPETL
jgi:hypothetical protein